MVGLASQNGSSLVGDSTVWQLDIDGGEWRQVASYLIEIFFLSST